VGLVEVPAAVLKYKPQQSSGGNLFCFTRQRTPRVGDVVSTRVKKESSQVTENLIDRDKERYYIARWS
jgi:hypothetical protein